MRHDLFRFSGLHVLHVAIVAHRWPQGGTHTGVIYRGEDGGLHLLELRGPRDLESRPWRGGYAHVIPNTDDDAQQNIASLCRVISRRNRDHPGEILYAFRFPKGWVNRQTGEIHLEEGLGLTCATFVLFVFLDAGVPLVDLANWPERPSDRPRQDELIRMFRAGGADPQDLQRAGDDWSCIFFNK
jgi:hypothetical protein